MRPVEEINLETRQGRVSLLHWASENPAAPKVLCLHGWLDNAASFLPLAQHLPELDLYALDFPGHGHSDHRPDGVRYAFGEYLFDLDAVIDALGWEETNLLGHSLGGGVSCAYSAAMPERIRKIALADGLGPYTGDLERTAKQLRESIEWVRRPRRPLRKFKSLEAIAEARQKGFLDISGPAARIICERAARKIEDDSGTHYIWRTDPALRWDSPIMISELQVLACLEKIRSPVLSYHAQPWTEEFLKDRTANRQAALRDGRFRDVQGNHHFHMDEAAKIAPEIRSFMMEQ